MREISLAAAAVPVLGSEGNIWFRGHVITTIPESYCNTKWRAAELASQGLEAPANFFLPTSKDGTRFLLYDEERFPVLVDISGVIGDHIT